MSALKELTDYVYRSKVGGRKVISTVYIDQMLVLVARESKKAATDSLDALNKGGEAHESTRHHITNRETDK
jgi:hypothetical protein